MSENNPTLPNDDELLSAYLDGELTKNERAEVEKRLRDDPAVRDLVEQLRGISQTMQTLPRLAADEGLRERVLAAVSTDEISLAAHDQSSNWGRRLVWPGLAVAAVLMLMFLPGPDFLPGGDTEEAGPVAKATRQKSNEGREAPQLRALAERKSVRSGQEDLAVASQTSSSEDESKLESQLSMETSEAIAASSAPRPAEEQDALSGSLGGSGFGGGLGGRRGGLPKRTSRSAAAEVCRVHLALNRSEWGGDQFDQLLGNRGIAMRGAGVNSKLLADSDSVLADGVRQRRDSGSELVLVEASHAQIEAVLSDFHADATHCLSIRITTPASQQNESAQNWQRLERGSRLADQPDPAGVAVALESVDFSSPVEPSRRGWAFRVQSGSTENETLEPSGSSLSKKHDSELGRPSSSLSDATTVRVMFVLHWQDAPVSGGEPPQAGEENPE